MMLYSPRDASELESVWRHIQASYAFARGDWSLKVDSSAGQAAA